MKDWGEIVGIEKQGDSWWYVWSSGIKSSGADNLMHYVNASRAKTDADGWRLMCINAWQESRVFWWRFCWWLLNVYSRKIWWKALKFARGKHGWIWK